MAYLDSLQIDESQKVYCHGDLNSDNIFIGHNLELSIIDFADAISAPLEYEQALIACELFGFENPYMLGYFGDYATDEMIELCMEGLLIHDFGSDILQNRIGPVKDIHSFDVLRARLHNSINGQRRT